MSWVDGRMLAFDIETTGTDTEEARIVSAAIAAVGGDQPPMVKTWLIDPGVEIPAEAAEVHGITTEAAQEHGLAPVSAIADIVVEVGAAVGSGLPLVAMNARFDLTILDRESRRHLGAPLVPEGFPLHVVDPFVIDKWLDRYRRGSRRLEALCEHYRTPLDNAHEASADAIAAARVAWRIGKHGRVVRRARNAREEAELQVMQNHWERVRHDLPALHDAQVVWAAEQAEGLVEYFERNGKFEEAESVQAAWPLVPFAEAVAS